MNTTKEGQTGFSLTEEIADVVRDRILRGEYAIGEKIKEIPGFPHVLESELKHCILSHHGEYEYGSPKKPAIIEAVALNFADNLDAKMETFKEAIASTESLDWMGFNRMLDSNIRITNVE